jgi:hypothetical protein
VKAVGTVRSAWRYEGGAAVELDGARVMREGVVVNVPAMGAVLLRMEQ